MTAELCATHPDPDLWWREDDLDEAWHICRRCPAFAGCERGQEIDLLEGNGFLLDGIPEPATVEVEHGKRGTGCTCLRCKAAHARYVAEWRQGRVTTAEPSTAGDQLNLWEMTA